MNSLPNGVYQLIYKQLYSDVLKELKSKTEDIKTVLDRFTTGYQWDSGDTCIHHGIGSGHDDDYQWSEWSLVSDSATFEYL